jgi:DNA-binding response OmpR family regulator
MHDMVARVLVIEDEPDIRDLLVILLEDDDRCATAYAVGDLDSALAVARDRLPTAIVLDFNLSGETAETALPELRELLPAARIVVFTASPEAAEKADVRRLGAHIVSVKGEITFDQLLDLVLGG